MPKYVKSEYFIENLVYSGYDVKLELELEFFNGKIVAKQRKLCCASTEPNKNNDAKRIELE